MIKGRTGFDSLESEDGGSTPPRSTKKNENNPCTNLPIWYNTTMKAKQQNTASILAALNYLIQKQRLEPKQIQSLLKISIMEAEENQKKVLR